MTEENEEDQDVDIATEAVRIARKHQAQYCPLCNLVLVRFAGEASETQANEEVPPPADEPAVSENTEEGTE
jgi:hypothetical protein